MKDIKIYFISCPLEKPDNGDYDYCNIIIKELLKISKYAQYVTLNTLNLITEYKGIEKKIANLKNAKSEEFYKKINEWKSDPERQKIVKEFINFIKEDSEKIIIFQ